MATSVTRHAITWTFSADKTVGQYANGDWWVVGPVTITGISPASTDNGTRIINGAMINPTAGMFVSQGLDSYMLGGPPPGSKYSASLNVARPGGNDLSAGNPLIVPAGSSLVSCVSHPTATNRPTLTDASVLTVVVSPPASGSFRPPYCGTDKTHYWNKSDLDYSILRSLPPVASTPALSTVEEYIERLWMEIGTSTDGRYYHPVNNQPDYGRDLSQRLEKGLLSLHLNYTDEQKETLFIRLVQFGLDVYGAAVSGGYWDDNGGFNMGRKMPMLLAALALNDANILAYCNAQSASPNGFRFQEDLQTWYVTADDVGRTLYSGDGRTREEYITEDIGIPEWGEKHTSTPNRDGRNWDILYRNTNYASTTGHALFAQMVPGAVDAWNWPAFFDYIDRAEGINAGSGYDTFTHNMWAAYRNISSAAAEATFSPPAGSYESARIVTISSATEGAMIHYTTNGDTPTEASPVVSGPIPVTESATVRSLVVKSGITNSQVSSAAYVIDTSGRPAAPTDLVITAIPDEESGPTGYILTGPASGRVGSARTFTISAVGGVFVGAEVFTPVNTGLTGSFSAATVTPEAGASSVTFQFTGSAASSGTIGVTDDQGWTDPAAIPFTVAAPSSSSGGSFRLRLGLGLGLTGGRGRSEGVPEAKFLAFDDGTVLAFDDGTYMAF